MKDSNIQEQYVITLRNRYQLLYNEPECSNATKTIQHLVRNDNELTHNLVLWEPTRGRRNRGRQLVRYTDVLKQDTGLESMDELKTAMMDRDEWRKCIKLGRADSRPE